ncbi:MAG: hypothetical protein LBD42_09595 [Desulfovibrio sp.]|jgi:hypothetical protein|nr:hypothetical protein [Desulfovibrio sp.]
MATQNLSAQAAEGNTPEPKYCTRYGVMTASDAALDLLDRARFRAAFIGTMLKACGKDGYDVTPGKISDMPEVKS